MYQKNFDCWPPGHPHDVPLSTSTVYDNFEQSVAKSPETNALVFYENCVTYQEMHEQVARMSAWLSTVAGVEKGQRVGIFSQNSPQFVIAYYAALRIGAVVVPMNPMYVAEELEFLLDDSDVKVLFAANELHTAFSGLVGRKGLKVVGIQYSDYLAKATDLPIPEFVKAQACPVSTQQLADYIEWQEAMSCSDVVPVADLAMDDLVMLPYTSGSTGNPKGCIHTNISVQHGMRSVYNWFNIVAGDVTLAVAPFFHVVGMQAGMNVAIAVGGTLVIVPRWDREVAAHALHNFHVTVWPAVPTMAIDLVNMPNFDQHDVSSLRVMFGGGSTMPDAIAKKLYDLCSVTFLEGYGMTETCCPATANPPQAAKAQCGGLPVFNTHVRILDHETLEEMPIGETGEVVISGPQVMQGYWNRDESNKESFIELDGARYLRTGDLGYMDEKGYLFIADRIKRMINASGFKVWPTQVEGVLYRHPAIQEVCVIASQDPKRGETVKALVVKSDQTPEVTAEEITHWSREHLAAYKIPKIVEFVESLPKSASGKVLWRMLQEQENEQAKQALNAS